VLRNDKPVDLYSSLDVFVCLAKRCRWTWHTTLDRWDDKCSRIFFVCVYLL